VTSYAVITPVRDEAVNLARVTVSLAEQTIRPDAWIIVDTGSVDTTTAVAAKLAEENSWIRSLFVPDSGRLERGAPITRAFEAGLVALDTLPDVVVKLDADLSLPRHYFARLLAEFEADRRLGLASGTCYELEDGVWRPRHVTAGTVWGASRAYRWTCLRELLPLHPGMGWDGIDEARAAARGWHTRTLTDLPFRHHRREGERDGAQRRARAAQGRAARFMGYRFPYLVLRALHHARRERDLAPLAIIWGYVAAAVRAEPHCHDPAVRKYMRERQRLRALPLRAREVGRRGDALPLVDP
jgi:biofilm PGA synthesis N-glycosyltransferase PgaC